jgi:hypothetical protein
LAIKGATELILEKAVEIGLANSKTDALRIGALCMNKEYKLVKDFEMELVARKINKEKEEMARKGQKYLTEKEALAKYAKKR